MGDAERRPDNRVQEEPTEVELVCKGKVEVEV